MSLLSQRRSQRRSSNTADGAAEPAQLGRLAEMAQRAVLRTNAGPLRPVWALLYRLCAQVAGGYLRRGHRGAAVYALGGIGTADTIYGVSDIDLVVVVPRIGGQRADARESIEARYQRLCRHAPFLRRLISLTVYEVTDLERGIAATPSLAPDPAASARRDRALRQPSSFDKPPDVALRAGCGVPPGAWRLVGGEDRRPSAQIAEVHEPKIAAWLELQHWWRHAFSVCLPSPGLHKPYLTVKLAAEPARIWIWLTERELLASRREVLERAIGALPDERETFVHALSLLRNLHRSPEPPVREMLAAFLRMSARIEEWLASDVAPAGVTEVGLVWGGEEELALPAGARDSLEAALGAGPRLLPLADWRALAHPGAAPDEVIAPVPGSPADPPTVAAMALLGSRGPYPALSADRLLVLPAPNAQRTKLRAVQCALSDPVSFALLRGSAVASFPNLAGWSIQETAARAVAQHRALLATSRGDLDSYDRVGRLLSCARAALLLESVKAGIPELRLTLRASAAGLGPQYPRAQAVAEEACEQFAAWRATGAVPSSSLAPELLEHVLRLPAYR